MYFRTYEDALDAAKKQSTKQLMDCKLYIKCDLEDVTAYYAVERFKIGFTPDNAEDGYVYNGKFFSVKTKEKEGN